MFVQDAHRFNAHGTRDAGFALANPPAETMLVQPDGKIVAVGSARARGKRWIVVRRHLG